MNESATLTFVGPSLLMISCPLWSYLHPVTHCHLSPCHNSQPYRYLQLVVLPAFYFIKGAIPNYEDSNVACNYGMHLFMVVYFIFILDLESSSRATFNWLCA